MLRNDSKETDIIKKATRITRFLRVNLKIINLLCTIATILNSQSRKALHISEQGRDKGIGPVTEIPNVLMI